MGMWNLLSKATKEGYKTMTGRLQSNGAINAIKGLGEGTMRSLRRDLTERAKTANLSKQLFGDGEKAAEKYIENNGVSHTFGESSYKTLSDSDLLKSLAYNRNGEASLGNVAQVGVTGALGAYAGVAIPGRIITGGGLYRDSDGNFDIMGIPIV